MILISKLFIQVISRQLYPATSRTLDKFQFPSAATATKTLSLWDRTSAGLGTGANFAMSRCGPHAINGPQARTLSILTPSKMMIRMQLQHSARSQLYLSITTRTRAARLMKMNQACLDARSAAAAAAAGSNRQQRWIYSWKQSTARFQSSSSAHALSHAIVSRFSR